MRIRPSIALNYTPPSEGRDGSMCFTYACPQAAAPVLPEPWSNEMSTESVKVREPLPMRTKTQITPVIER